jgi:hypothetical protein
MSKVPDSDTVLEILVNCKTYPAVSEKYIETVCTGGIDRRGSFVRLYPVPFRFLDGQEQYDRWDIIRVKVYRDTKDKRPESWHLQVGSPIQVIGKAATDRLRWDWMRKGVFASTEEMEREGRTNGLVEIVPHELYWEREAKAWSPRQKAVLTQGRLFHDERTMQSLAERIPWQFKLRLTEKQTGRDFDQKVLAWSFYQGFRRNLRETGSETAALERVRDNVYHSILSPNRTVFAIFGTHSRFRHWMISALYHLPTAVCTEPLLGF